MRAVRYDRFAGIDGLEIAERPDPVAAAGTAVVRVRATGINPGSLSALDGAAYVPNRDLAGEVVAVGDGVADLAVGDPVLGVAQDWWAHAELVAVPAAQLVRKPPALSWDVAGCLYTTPMAGLAGVRAVRPRPGELVVVSGASGGVGLTAAQLARRAGATVIGLTSADKASRLKDWGIEPIEYGDGQEERIRAVAGGRRVDAFIDSVGRDCIALAVGLGVDEGRITTAVDYRGAAEAGVQARGTRDAGGLPAFRELAELAAAGDLEVPIAAAHPLADVRAAYRALAERRPFGRIVLHPQE